MSPNNSRKVAYSLLNVAEVPTSLEHNSVTSMSDHLDNLSNQDISDRAEIASIHRDWLAARAKCMVQRLARRRLRRDIANRSNNLIEAELRLSAARDALASGISRNRVIVKEFLESKKARKWYVGSANSRHRRFLLVPATRLLIDIIAHPEPATRPERCSRCTMLSTDHVAGPALKRLCAANAVISEEVKNVFFYRIHPAFASLLSVKPVPLANSESSDESYNLSLSDSDSSSGSGGSDGSNSSDNSVDSDDSDSSDDSDDSDSDSSTTTVDSGDPFPGSGSENERQGASSDSN